MLLTLFERVIVEADSALEAMVANPPADLKALWRTGINVFVETFGSHRAVSLAADARAHQHRPPRSVVAVHAEVGRPHRRGDRC